GCAYGRRVRTAAKGCRSDRRRAALVRGLAGRYVLRKGLRRRHRDGRSGLAGLEGALSEEARRSVLPRAARLEFRHTEARPSYKLAADRGTNTVGPHLS